MSHASEPDSGHNPSGNDERRVFPALSEIAAQTPAQPFNEHVSRLRYHPRRTSSVVSSSSLPGTDLHSDPFRHEHASHLFPDMSNEARRQNLMAMDRKRRLTGSTQEEGRRRQGSTAFPEHNTISARTLEHLSSLSHPAPPRRMSSQVPASAEVIDLTGSSPVRGSNPLPPLPPTSIESVYVLPTWQPDSEASECPICKRPFGFLFRRHHCRKCGRVVCNDCSPHRITIPRQYIVSPPGHETSSEADVRDANDPSGEGDDDLDPDDNDDTDEDTVYASTLSRRRRRARAHRLSLGGGEKVRLCNPCVPDPQPEHQSNYASHTLPLPSRLGRRTESIFANLPQPRQIAPPTSRDSVEPFPGMPALNYAPAFNYQPSPRPYRNHASTLDSFGLSNSTVPSLPRASYHAGNYERSGTTRDQPHVIHGHYHSFGHNRAGLHPTMRPRIRSMLDEVNNFQRVFPPQGPALRGAQVKEEDMCPICRRQLPPKGADGNETDREAHIMNCISSRDPTQSSQSGSPGALSSPSRGPMHMLTFVATEKDCVSDDGGPLECSICMVEYDVGEQLARLECLCKFHRECIVSWFERKPECPVHKIT